MQSNMFVAVLCVLCIVMMANVQVQSLPSIDTSANTEQAVKENAPVHDESANKQVPSKDSSATMTDTIDDGKTTPINDANGITVSDDIVVLRNPSERLKKGLSSLLSQWNNTPFYAASVATDMQMMSGSSTTAAVGHDDGDNPQTGSDPSLVMINSSAEGLVKQRVGRMAHTRPLGRPLRWG